MDREGTLSDPERRIAIGIDRARQIVKEIEGILYDYPDSGRASLKSWLNLSDKTDNLKNELGKVQRDFAAHCTKQAAELADILDELTDGGDDGTD